MPSQNGTLKDAKPAQAHQSKPTPLACTVTNIKESIITASTSDWSITREALKFLRLSRNTPLTGKGDDEEMHEEKSDTNKQSEHD